MSLVYRDLLYAICVAHGYILTMEAYSPKKMSTKSRLTAEDLIFAVNFARKYFKSSSENLNLSLRDICNVICKVILIFICLLDCTGKVPSV